ELGDDVFTPAMPGLARCQLEPGALIDMPRSGKHAVRPQGDFCVAFGSREAHALMDKPCAEAESARLWIDEQQAEARDVGLVVFHQHDAADVLALYFSDPAALTRGIEIVDKIGDDLGAQAFKRFGPAVFLQIEFSVT